MKLAHLLTEAKAPNEPYNPSRDESHERTNFALALYHTQHQMNAIKAGDQAKAAWHKGMSAHHAALDNGYANSPYKED